ncbi:MAG TPA: glycosyltransferase family A protein [Verrucomicrobiae bacterium]|nr:glycosyltransferase family A protein [Verrucomicrobiae bacterium]
MSDTNPVGPIAVIIPAYNQGPYLREAVESVMRQTLPASEIIVVDDGSTDDTAEVLNGLRREYPQLAALSQANAGVCEASRNGLAHVSAPYVVRLDADDILPDNYLQSLFSILEKQPKEVAFAYSDAQLFGAKEGWIHARPWSIAALVPENYIHVSSLVRTDAARQVGYFNPAMRGGYEDWDFYLSLVDAGFRGVYCKETHLLYRQKEEGGRNTMDRERDHALRAQVRANHPALYTNLWYKIRIFLWRLARRLKHWAGKA